MRLPQGVGDDALQNRQIKTLALGALMGDLGKPLSFEPGAVNAGGLQFCHGIAVAGFVAQRVEDSLIVPSGHDLMAPRDLGESADLLLTRVGVATRHHRAGDRVDLADQEMKMISPRLRGAGLAVPPDDGEVGVEMEFGPQHPAEFERLSRGDRLSGIHNEVPDGVLAAKPERVAACVVKIGQVALYECDLAPRA